MRIDSSGNVGIGTDSPANTLTVGTTENSTVDQDATVGIKCNANHKGIMLQENSGGEQWSMGVGEGGSLKFYDSAIATPAVTFEDVTGNVGIGTDSPAQALHVVGKIRLESNFPAIEFVDIDNNPDFTITGGNGRIGFYDETNNSERMSINSSGNVGIGTNSPEKNLHLAGANAQYVLLHSTHHTNFAGDVSGGLLFMNGDDSVPEGDRITAALKATVEDSFGRQALTFSTSTTNPKTSYAQAVDYTDNTIERMRIDSTGNVGIGTTSPAQALDVVGNITLDDNGKLLLGASDDLQLYHDGSNSYVKDSGTGSLVLQGASFVLMQSNEGENMVRGQKNAQVDLYHDNDIKLSTASTGIDVVGNIAVSGTVDGVDIATLSTNAIVDGDFTTAGIMTTDGSGGYSVDASTYLTAHQDISGKADVAGDTFTGDVLFNDGVKAKFGTDSDLLIYHNDGEPSVIEDAGELGLVLKTNGNIFGVLSDTNESMITATPNDGVTLHYDGTSKLSVGQDSVAISEDLTVQIGHDLSVLGGDLNVTGDIIVSGTVDGVDIATLNSNAITAHQDITGKADLSGATFTGNVRVSDDVELRLGDGVSGDLRIFHSSANGTSTIREQGSGSLVIQGENLNVTDTSSKSYLSAIAGGATKIYHNGSTRLETVAAGISVSGDIAVSGTVDGVDIAALNTTVSGKANLSGATFTGNVAVGIPPSGTQSLTVAGTTSLYGGVTGGLDVIGNITVSGTVDGRDVAADGTKLDSLKGTLTSNYWDAMQWQQGASRQLTTTLTQYGDTQYVKHTNTVYKTYVDLSLDLVYNSASGTNDAFGYLSVIAPSPTGEATVNMGTCTLVSTGVSYITGFAVSGDWTEYLSRYAGLSKNSDGSNAMGVPHKWAYNPNVNTTTMWVSAYGNPPSNGDTIYSHPFDWEPSGTEINGETLSIDNSSGSGVNFRRDYKIYLGRFQQRAGYKFQAKENLSSDVVALDTLRMITTEYEA